MILVDSSLWIELLRGDPSDDLRTLLRQRADELATTGPIVMEMLAGSGNVDRHEQMLAALIQRPVDPHLDYPHAAAIYRAARAGGVTIRSLNDCLIAAVALRFGDTVAHREADFDHIAAVTGLPTIRA